jgi:hypothetical protein
MGVMGLDEMKAGMYDFQTEEARLRRNLAAGPVNAPALAR